MLNTCFVTRVCMCVLQGAEHWDKNKAPQIFLHGVQEAEIQPRNKVG